MRHSRTQTEETDRTAPSALGTHRNVPWRSILQITWVVCLLVVVFSIVTWVLSTVWWIGWITLFFAGGVLFKYIQSQLRSSTTEDAG